MTKSELIEVLAQETGLTKGRAELVVNTVFDSMVEALQRGEGVELRGFCSFTVRQYKAYEGRNPRTGDTVHVPPKRLPFFKAGKDLRERVNGKRPQSGTDAPVARRRAEAKAQAAAATKQASRQDANVTEDAI